MRSRLPLPDRSPRLTTGLAAAATPVLLLLAGCTSASPPPDSGADADLGAYLGQELDWVVRGEGDRQYWRPVRGGSGG
ncbi:hypothetical protein [Nocardiopsis synnemataformans]|uniref:hypothetical protein n=1 Tax=Nocardiopsis synnemataformans TaxID=61305 RepID=UPI003EB765FE